MNMIAPETTFGMRVALLLALTLLTPAQAQQTADSSAALFQDGLTALKASQFTEAEAAFRKQLVLEPDALLPCLAIAQVFMARRKPDDALLFLREESAKHSGRADLRVALGDTALRAAHYDEAIAAFRSALEVEGKIAPAFFVPRGTTGVIAPSAKEESDPVAVSLSVLTGKDLTPKGEAGIHVRLAETLQMKHDAAGAAAEWQKVSDLIPKNPGVVTNLAMQLEASGKKTEALKAYREALLLAPSSPVIMNNLAFLIADTGGDLYEALRLARRANMLAPGTPSIMDTEAWVALKQGFTDDALGSFLRLVEREPENIEFRKHLSAAITQRNIRSSASDELMKVLNRPVIPGDQEIIRSLLRNLTAEGVSRRN